MRSLAYTDGETFTLDLRGLSSDLSFIWENNKKKTLQKLGVVFMSY